MRGLMVLFGLVAAGPASAQVVLNEMLADPGTAGDANCDSVFSSTDDEFVEIVNAGNTQVDLSNGTITDLVQVRHTFPAGTVLQPGQAVVVFGGGTPMFDGTSASAETWCRDLPGVLFQTSSTGSTALNNTGDTITLTSGAGIVLDSYVYGVEGNNDNSLVRIPEGSTAAMVEHTTTGFGAWSPGTTVGGVPWSGVAAEPVLSQATPGISGQQNTWTLTDGPPNELAVFLYGTAAGVVNVPGCPGLQAGIASPKVLGSRSTDANGDGGLQKVLPAQAAGRNLFVQAVFGTSCVVSNVSITRIQ